MSRIRVLAEVSQYLRTSTTPLLYETVHMDEPKGRTKRLVETLRKRPELLLLVKTLYLGGLQSAFLGGIWSWFQPVTTNLRHLQVRHCVFTDTTPHLVSLAKNLLDVDIQDYWAHMSDVVEGHERLSLTYPGFTKLRISTWAHVPSYYLNMVSSNITDLEFLFEQNEVLVDAVKRAPQLKRLKATVQHDAHAALLTVLASLANLEELELEERGYYDASPYQNVVFPSNSFPRLRSVTGALGMVQWFAEGGVPIKVASLSTSVKLGDLELCIEQLPCLEELSVRYLVWTTDAWQTMAEYSPGLKHLELVLHFHPTQSLSVSPQ